MSTPYFVFLAGPATGQTFQAAHRWREYVTQCFPPHIQGVSPLRAKRFLDDGTIMGRKPLPFPVSTDRAHGARNRSDLRRSSAVLVNLLGTRQASIGTAMEIAWAFERGTPVVAALEPEGNPHDHAMIRDCLTVRVASLDEAIEAVVAIVSPNEASMWDRIEQSKMLLEENRLDLSQEPLKETTAGRGFLP